MPNTWLSSCAMWLGQDITEIREKELAVQRAQKMEAIGQLTGGMAHDFNNLLTIIQGNLSLLAEDVQRLDEANREILEDAISAANDGSNLTSQLLAFARRQPLKSQNIDVNALITKLTRMIRRTIGEGVDITLQLDATDPHATVDPSQLESSILNLCLNARDAMNWEGSLTLSSGTKSIGISDAHVYEGLAPGHYIEIKVQDSGSGMSQERIDRAFEPFYTSKEAGEGSGLGLSMVQGFALQSKGTAYINSKLNVGTEVALLLPMSSDPIRMAVDNAHDEELLLSSANRTILVVEDEPRVRKFAVRCLSQAGYLVLEADSGSRALDMLRSHEDISLVFSDVVMPGGMTGRFLAAKIQAEFPSIDVRLATGYDEQFEAAEHDAKLLRKPYTRSELLAYISEDAGSESEFS